MVNRERLKAIETAFGYAPINNRATIGGRMRYIKSTFGVAIADDPEKDLLMTDEELSNRELSENERKRLEALNIIIR